MSLYTIAAASLTTHDDRRRRPAVNQGQVGRTLALCLIVAVALMVMARQSHAQATAEHHGFRSSVGSLWQYGPGL